MRFLIGFGDWLGVRPVVTLQEHISFMTVMMLVFGLIFQTPMVVLVLAKMGLVTVRTLNNYRRHVIVVIVILAAVRNPARRGRPNPPGRADVPAVRAGGAAGVCLRGQEKADGSTVG